MKNKYPLYFLPLLLVLFLSCNKEEPAPAIALPVEIMYEVEGQPLLPDALLYETPGGYTYSVSRLEFYLSGFRLVKPNGDVVTVADTYYVNFKEAPSNRLLLHEVTPGEYWSMQFNIGLAPATNKTGALPNKLANANMAWPEPMGGGYHFLKLEGRYTTSGTEEKGYALHLGTNGNLVTVHLNQVFSVSNSVTTLQLVMNLNEWLRNPHPLDFEVDGTNSMYNPLYMQKLAANGTTTFKLNAAHENGK